jgi:peptidoglycan/xylan/chitin deacetylase (PgdA/CDA1 family)
MTARRGSQRWRHAGSVRAGRFLLSASRQLSYTDAIALTFDDGPDPEFTPKVLAALSEADALASFFVVGERARDHPELVRELVARGHAVGSHSLNHRDVGRMSIPITTLVAEYRQARAIIEQTVGRPVKLFRPPYGNVDMRVAVAARVVGYRTWLWSVDTGDWTPDATVTSIVGRAGDVVGGDVVLLHDGIVDPANPAGANRTATVEAIPGIVEQARRRGLRLVTLPHPRA